MAKKVKSEDQGLLFDLAPEKPKAKKASLKSQVTYQPQKKELNFVIIAYKDGRDVSHWFTPESYVDRFVQSTQKRGLTTKVMAPFDYWEKWHKGEFVTGKP